MSGDYERKLVNLLDKEGYAIMRAPSSGGGTKRNLPDVHWSKVGEASKAGELKTTSRNVAYYDREEVDNLQEFAVKFGSKARLIARFKGDTTFYVYRVSDARATNGDSDRLAVDRDMTPSEVIEP